MAGLRYRGRRLDGPIEEFHQAVDRLRWDTIPAPATTNPPAHQGRRIVAAMTQRRAGRPA